MKSARAYRQVARADAAALTRRRIIDAAVALFARDRWETVTLEAIAIAAGVTRQTVLRLFGAKEGLLAEAARVKSSEILAEREPAKQGDVEQALDRLVESYEQMGTLNWHLLLQEDQLGVIREVLGRRARAPSRLAGEGLRRPPAAPGRERQRRIALLFAATDFYVFKLYRRDLGLPRAETRQRMGELVMAALRSFREGT